MGTATTAAHLAVLAEESLEHRGDHDSLVFEERTWRSAELHDRACRVAGGLHQLGVRAGDRVAVVMANCTEVSVTYNAVWRAGAAVTPVVVLATATELRHVLADSSATTVVTTGDQLDKVLEAATGLPTVRHVVVAEPGTAAGSTIAGEPAAGAGVDVVDFDQLERGDDPGIVSRDEADLAALMYTGGTTGRAKGVELSHRNLWFCGRSAHEASYVPGLTRGLSSLPMSHAFGMIVTVTSMHAPDPSLAVLMRWFDPARWVALVEEYQVERSALVPAMAQFLLAEPLESADLSNLRYLTIGAAPLARETAQELERRLPNAEVLEGYGCTESGGVITANPPGKRKIGTVGMPIPGYEVRIVDEQGEQVPAGEAGEIAVRAEGVMRGYWNAPDATATALRDGWLYTGDIGRLDDENYLTIVDRKKDIIIRNGFNVYPRDVEDVLVEHPAVAMAGVVGRPDDRVGEEVIAFVSLHQGESVSAEELTEFARSRLAASKYPREIHVLDSLPLTSVAKLDRKELRRRVHEE
ncbi:AMP-binding protein [Haloechinothrix sp. LS1_15]|uniref:class I adenylate-forming enzyme family protein n=1 Tax=Haloechinothrix sp. LS1_15 TaxID=2652248 RepID=UPI0029462911|nr:AMP-binding protein [Haloechinothrix sp. LS1_15]MDV6012505.1 long-chain fatty acid--CoA ligase [Haloechinothrix sp. LS1_15]